MSRPAKTNGFDPDKTLAIVETIEAADRALVKEHMEYMQRCKQYHETKKAVIKARALERKAKEARDGLEDIDLVDKFDLIRHAIGDLPFEDTPLARAAAEREAAAVPL